MANFNKVVLIGRLTRDPEARTFPSGGMVSKFGFAVTNRRKNGQTGQWEDEPMFIDVEVFNRGKGSQVMVEGRLHLDQWDDKTTGQKRSKHKIVVENLQLLDPRQGGDGPAGMGTGDGGMEDEMGAAPPPRPAFGGNRGATGGGGRGPAPQQRSSYSAPPDDDGPAGGNDGEIPF